MEHALLDKPCALLVETVVTAGGDLVSFAGVDLESGNRLIVTIHFVDPPAHREPTETFDLRGSDLVLSVALSFAAQTNGHWA